MVREKSEYIGEVAMQQVGTSCLLCVCVWGGGGGGGYAAGRDLLPFVCVCVGGGWRWLCSR